jgi:hypothetical protein
MRQKFIVTVALCLAQLAVVHSASAAFPDRPVRLIVTSPPATPAQLVPYLAQQQKRWTDIVATTHISAEQ